MGSKLAKLKSPSIESTIPLYSPHIKVTIEMCDGSEKDISFSTVDLGWLEPHTSARTMVEIMKIIYDCVIRYVAQKQSEYEKVIDL